MFLVDSRGLEDMNSSRSTSAHPLQHYNQFVSLKYLSELSILVMVNKHIVLFKFAFSRLEKQALVSTAVLCLSARCSAFSGLFKVCTTNKVIRHTKFTMLFFHDRLVNILPPAFQSW
jgi:hypothetical protein